MKTKLQRAKRTLDNMKKRESDALAGKAAVEEELAALKAAKAAVEDDLNTLRAAGSKV